MKALLHSMPITEARAGMVLAETVCDDSGAVLLAAGATLTEVTLNALRRRDIALLGIVANNDDKNADGESINSAASAASEAERVRQCARLARLFRHNAALGATGALLERLVHYRRTHSPC